MNKFISQKRFIVVVVGIMLCLGMVAWAGSGPVSTPASSSGTEYVTTAEQLKNAVSNDSVSHIIVTGNIDLPATWVPSLTGGNCGLLVSRDADHPLTLELSNDSVLSVSGDNCEVACIHKEGEGKLTINGKGTISADLTAHDSGYGTAFGVKVQSGTADISDSVKITAAASGDSGVAYGIFVYSSTATANISGSVDITASSGASHAYGVFVASGTTNISGSVDITASGGGDAYGVFVASGTTNISGSVDITASGASHAYGVYASGATANISGSVNITASGGSDVYGVFVASGTTNILSAGLISGDLTNSDTLTVHAGTFTMDPTANGATLGKSSICTPSGSNWVVTNLASMDITPDTLPNVQAGEAKTMSVDVQLLKAAGLVPCSIDILTVTPLSASGITAVASSTDHNVTFNVPASCPAGAYTFAITGCALSGDTTAVDHTQTKELTVNILQEGSIIVSTAEELIQVLQKPDVTQIALSNDYSGDISSPVTVSGDNKTLNLCNATVTFTGSGDITVPTGASLDITGAGTVSKDTGPIFNSSGTLKLSAGSYYAGNGEYFGSGTTSGNVTITGGTKFYFASQSQADTFASKWLADGQTLEEGTGGWYTVKQVTPTPTPTSGSGGGGCNAGFGIIALLGLALIPMRRKK